MATEITVTPAYGRDYNTAEEAVAHWHASKDFILQDRTSRWDRKPINKEDAERIPGLKGVRILFDKGSKSIVVPIR